MQKLLLVGFILTFMWLEVAGQTGNRSTVGQWIRPEHPIAYHVDGLINLASPGLAVGIEKRFKSSSRDKSYKGQAYTTYRDQVFEGNLSWYRQSVVQQVGTLTGLYTIRKVSGYSRRFNSVSLGFGVVRSFLPETYRSDSEGNINKVFLPGSWYVAPTVAYSLGRYKMKVNRASQLKIIASLYLGYNGSFVPNVAVSYGYRFGKRN